MTISDIIHKYVWQYVTFAGIVLCGKDSPDPPDYTAAAEATAAGDANAARVGARANRINSYTPYGNQIFTELGNDRWRSDIFLSPTEQKKLNKNSALELGLLDTAIKGLGSVNQAMFSGLNESKLAQPSIQGQAVQDAIMSRLAPQFAREEEAMRTRLTNQGVAQGSEAWDNDINSLGQQRNDAYIQAALQGINTGQAARQQGIQEQYAAQDRPLNIINALRSGSQVNLPQFAAPGSQQTVSGPNYLGAMQSQYGAELGASNAKNAGINNLIGGLFSMGGSYFGGR